MPFTARIQAVDRDIRVWTDKALAPAARSQMIAEFAESAIADAEHENEQALHHTVPYDTFVDGRKDAPLVTVNPDHGTIVADFKIIENIFDDIGRMLVEHSPVRHGGYKESFRFYADGVQVPMGKPPPYAEEYIFLNTEPYARKIEHGLSPQAPDGVFQVVAALASRKYGKFARIKFSYRSVFKGAESGGVGRHGNRTPAIEITLK